MEKLNRLTRKQIANMYMVKIYEIEEIPDIAEVFVVILQSIVLAKANVLNQFWIICPGAYAGYGETVCGFESSVSEGKSLGVLGKDLYLLLSSKNEYFYNVDIEVNDQKIIFGIFDSTYAYFGCNSKILAQKTLRSISKFGVCKSEISHKGKKLKEL